MTEWGALSPHDFELLVQDLLSAREEATFESFSPGRDEGIDLRHVASPDRLTIAQCKHYYRSGYSALQSAVRRDVTRAKNLNADHYVLATSVPMTPQRKRELATTLESVAPTVEVVGPEDLQKLLRDFPRVETSHFKLWVQSTAILQRVLHNAVMSRTEAKIRDLLESSALFVSHPGVLEAQDIIDTHHVLLISGAPGVGKSALADTILLQLVAEDYQPIIVSSDILEAENTYQTNTKQVFYYDDFLGRTSLTEKLSGNEDNRLFHFIERVSRDASKRLIMTSRHHLLELAVQTFDRLDEPKVNRSRFVLNMTKYSMSHRAHILYNHLYFSSLNQTQLREFVESRIYRDIVRNRNFNPRLVSTAITALEGAPVAGPIGTQLRRYFEDPATLWRRVVSDQLSPTQRFLLAFMTLAAGTNNRGTPLVEMERAFSAHLAAEATTADLNEDLRVLEGVAVRVQGGPTAPSRLALTNPGVEDAVIRYVLTQPAIFSALLRQCKWSELTTLWNLAYERDEISRRSSGAQLLPACPVEVAKRQALWRLATARQNDVWALLARAAEADPDIEKLSSLLTIVSSLSEPLVARTALLVTLRPLVRLWENWDAEKSASLEVLSVLVRDPSCLPEPARGSCLKEILQFVVEAEDRTLEDFKAHYDALKLAHTQALMPISETHYTDMIDVFGDYFEHALDRFESSHDVGQVRTGLEELERCADYINFEYTGVTDDLWSRIESAEESQEEESHTLRFPQASSAHEQYMDSLFDSLADC